MHTSPRRLLLIGFGSVGQALAPLLPRHTGLRPEQVTALAADDDGRGAARQLGIGFERCAITPANLASTLARHLAAGDVLINVAVDVASLDLITWCQAHQVLYLDTGIEPWPGGYAAADASTSNYALRHAALALHRPGAPTAVVAHGANPGLITHLVKAGLEELAARRGVARTAGQSWAQRARDLGIRVLQVAERDTQIGAAPRRRGEFVNTWSAEGLLTEAWQCAELGWGSHERSLPADGRRHDFGDQSGIWLAAHGAAVQVRSWVPSVGEQPAWLLTHHEALSLAHLLTVPGSAPDRPAYRPTVYYAYHPCPDTAAALEEWVASGYAPPAQRRVLRDELTGGTDELGALFIWPGGAWWYGSTLTLAAARALAPGNNATTLQVAAGIVGALEWLLRNPRQGVVEAEALDHRAVLATARPYLGQVGGTLTPWQPGAPGDLQFTTFRRTTSLEEESS